MSPRNRVRDTRARVRGARDSARTSAGHRRYREPDVRALAVKLPEVAA